MPPPSLVCSVAAMLSLRPLRRYQLVTDLVVAGLFGLLALSLELASDAPSVPVGVGASLMVVAFTAAAAMRRLSPGLALALAWAGALLQMGLGRQPSPTDVVVFAVLYTTAAYGTRRVFWAGFVSAVGGAVVVSLYLVVRTLTSPIQPEDVAAIVGILLAAAFALLLAWVTGALVRTAIRATENGRAQRAAEAETIAEQQRVRIARDMHDVVAHSLAVVIAQADGARYAATADPEAATAALATISTTARAALTDVRQLLTQLRHTQAEGPQPRLADLDALYTHVRAAGVELSVDVDPVPPGEPPAAIQLAVYRILQEALTNALRHGADPRVDVYLGWLPDHVELLVRNARAADAPAPPSGGHGLIGMRERAQLVGGRLTAEAQGRFFVVRATLPVRASP
ncbi:histidine kinase [Microbacterium testaceum]|uniref:histidine kinase n=2 Tax=Microbacterium testaceum TaxID=2033 RepID=A0A147F094_MICTE|nr:histidine kinase [Microbacterium testaceum]